MKAQIEDKGVKENLSLKQDEQVAAIQLHDCKEKSKVVIEFENESAVEMDHFPSVSGVGMAATVINTPSINANDHGQRVTSDSLVVDPESDAATVINSVPTSDAFSMQSSKKICFKRNQWVEYKRCA